MIEVPNCVICYGPIRRLKRALVAPFLARRIWNRNPFCVDLVQCEACGFLFYNPRLDENDLRRLYADYRLEDYQRMRQASEPWYTARFNDELASPASYEFRRGKLAPILRQQIGDRKIDRILDHGGDRGDLVAGLFDGAEAFVYEISGIPPASGVTAATDPAACTPDLILNSNVLEHVGSPRELVAEILKSAPKGGLVYLEVPCEHPFESWRILRRIAQIGIIALTHPSLARFVLRPAALYMMHEHINYYTEQTLATLMRSAGGTVLASGRYALGTKPGDAEVVWVMGSSSLKEEPNYR
jgi:hypothetical protein